MIRIESVTKRLGKATAVDGVSLDIPAGDAVALWGKNGAGKTTLIRCVIGLLRYRGRISIDGLDVRRRGKATRMLVGYVPQELAFYDDLGVGEAIRFFGKLKGISVGDPEDVLSGVGLAGHEGKRVRELSGGMKQRLALSVAMLGDPPVLVLDEVTASLDACGRAEFISLLTRLSGAGRTLLFASHRLEEVGTLARRVVEMERGRVVRESEVRAFASRLGADMTLHLVMKPAACTAAMHALTASGFAPRLNGVGLYVPVPAEQKAGPFRVLAEARIAVDDFEIVQGPVADRSPSTTEARP